MCGIAGYLVRDIKFDGNSRLFLHRMAGLLEHRGPDDEGFYEQDIRWGNYSVGLAHRRLSIIDLDSGHQPQCNEDGSIHVVFNGEIYNFRELRTELIRRSHFFKTYSDTETIVHAYEEYGEDCVHHFRGMFAFAIWDARRERLFLARDRYGKKPLFLWENDGSLFFASEIKALLACPQISAEVDLEAVWHYLSLRYVPGPLTLFKGIRKLLPGHYAVWEKGNLREVRYFTPPDCGVIDESIDSKDPVGDFLDKLDEAVRIRMVSDVPFGAFLSGGIDSSAVVGLMSRHSDHPVRTFSVGFAESDYSELGYAGIIADRFGTEHHELTVSQSHLMDELPALVRFRDAPVSEPSDIPIYLLSKEARRTVKMVLTGEGSDEILGGYPKHVFERYVCAYQRLPRLLRCGLIEPVVAALPYRFRRAKTAVVNMGIENWPERMGRWFGALSARERDLLVSERFQGIGGDIPLDIIPDEASSPLRRILCFDQLSWLPDNLLERGDRMTMAASLEARMPFMDHELAAFVSSLPDEYRVRGHQTKWILRQAMLRLLPREILDRPKVGFRVPVNEWFRGQMKDYLCDHLLSPSSRTLAYYRRDRLQQLLDEHIRGRHNHEKLLWTLLNLEIWHREYGLTA